MTLSDLIKHAEANRTVRIAQRQQVKERIAALPATDPERETLAGRVAGLTAEIDSVQAELGRLRVEVERDAAADRLTRESHPTATINAAGGPVPWMERNLQARLAERDQATDPERRRELELEAELIKERLEEMRHETRDYRIGDPGSAGRTGRDDEPAPAWVRTNDLRPATVARGQRFADHAVVADHAATITARDQAVIGQHGSLGQLVRAMTTVSGAAIVPTVWAGDIIDRARALAAVLLAGAEVVPMDAKTVQIGRLTGDPTAAFRAEGGVITASDPTFDNVTLDSKTMSALVVGSLEWFMDADNVDEVVTEAIAQAVALQLDLVALYGSITAGAGSINLPTPPNPRGVLGALLATAASSVLGAQTNGTIQTALTFWNEVLDTIFTVRDFNEAPNALIWSSKLARQYAKTYDTTGQPLAVPAAVDELTRFVSNQIPSYTQGTMTNRATDLFAGDWSQLLIGQRLDFTVQTLTERYAENGQVGIVAHWRGDVGVARPRAFAVYRALQGAL